MTFMEDFKLINKGVISKSIESMGKNWMLIFTGFVYSIISIVSTILIENLFRGPLFIISGFISGFISAALISNYLYLLYKIIYIGRFDLDDFKQGFTQMLSKVYSVLVLAWIGRYFLSVFGLISAKGAFSIDKIIGFLVMIFLNALPETLYQKQYGGVESLEYCLNFIKDNALNWFIPNIIFGIILFFVTGQVVGGNILKTNINMQISFNLITLNRNLLGQVVFSFMMIYRGHLFQLLSTSTKRKREFMRNF